METQLGCSLVINSASLLYSMHNAFLFTLIKKCLKNPPRNNWVIIQKKVTGYFMAQGVEVATLALSVTQMMRNEMYK